MDSCHVGIGIFIDFLTQVWLLIKKKKTQGFLWAWHKAYVVAVSPVATMIGKAYVCHASDVCVRKSFICV